LDKYDINLNKDNIRPWILLLKFYNKINFKDVEIGLIHNFAAHNDYFVRNKSDFLFVLSDFLARSNNFVNKNIEIAKLLKTTFRLYDTENNNNQNERNNSYSEEKYDISLLIDEDLQDTIEEYAINYCGDIGEWESISGY